MPVHRNLIRTAVTVAALAAALACSKSGQGQLAVKLMDAPNPVVDEIWVHVAAVRVHDTTTGWHTVSSAPVDVDLLKLQDYAVPLGIVGLPAGKVTQLRLVLSPDGNHVVVGGVEQPLTVPSGIQSGVKILGPWTIGACEQTTVTLDFDGNKSIWVHTTAAGSEEWILRPVIRTKRAERSDGTCGGGGEGGEPGGSGAPCTVGSECLSGACETVCLPGGPEAPCRVDADCAAGTCGESGTCSTAGAAPTGSPCTSNAGCLSNACVDDICGPGQQGAPCLGDTDCDVGFSCQQNFCAAAANPL